VAHTYNPSYLEAEIRKILIQGSLGKLFAIPLLQNNKSKMDRKCGSKGRAPDLQVQSPEFKPHSHQNKSTGKNAYIIFTKYIVRSKANTIHIRQLYHSVEKINV
jgi:hypothetical protein